MDVGSEAAPGEAEGGSGRGKEDGSVLEPKSGPGGHSSILAAQSLFFFLFSFLFFSYFIMQNTMAEQGPVRL